MKKMSLNRYKFTAPLREELIAQIKEKRLAHPIFKQHVGEIKGGKLYLGGKRVLSPTEVPQALQYYTEKSDAPLGIRSLQHWMNQRFVGATRKQITDFLSVDKRLQDMRQRPATSTVVRVRGKKEGKTSFELKKYPNALGLDLIAWGKRAFSPEFTEKFTHALVCVHKYSGYIWALNLLKPDSTEVTKAFAVILKDSQEKFGRTARVDVDDGSEFKSHFRKFCKAKRIDVQTLAKVSYVERANSTLKRTVKFLAPQHRIRQALLLACKKMRQTPNRITGLTPAEVVGMPIQKRPTRKHRSWQGGRVKTPVFRKGDQVEYLSKVSKRETSVLYKSFNGQTWKGPTEVLYRKNNAYRLRGQPNFMFKPHEIRPYVKPVTRTRPNYRIGNVPKIKPRKMPELPKVKIPEIPMFPSARPPSKARISAPPKRRRKRAR